MGKSSFGTMFGGTLGIFAAIGFVVIGLPILACGGCFGLCAGVSTFAPPPSERLINNPAVSTASAAVEQANEETTAAEENVETVHEKPKRYEAHSTTILESEGKGAKKTASFTVTSDATYQLAYAYRANVSDFGGAGTIFVVLIEGGFFPAPVVNEANNESNSDSTILRLSPGTYSVDVNAANCNWTLKIVETKQVEVNDDPSVGVVTTPIDEEPETSTPELVSEPEPLKSKHVARTWRAATGGFSVDATFIKFGNGQVTIKRADNGKEVTIPLEKLSEEDKQFIKSLR